MEPCGEEWTEKVQNVKEYVINAENVNGTADCEGVPSSNAVPNTKVRFILSILPPPMEVREGVSEVIPCCRKCACYYH